MKNAEEESSKQELHELRLLISNGRPFFRFSKLFFFPLTAQDLGYLLRQRNDTGSSQMQWSVPYGQRINPRFPSQHLERENATPPFCSILALSGELPENGASPQYIHK